MDTPTRRATGKAQRLQQDVIGDEAVSGTYVDDEMVQRATIHARQDQVLIYSMLASIHSQAVAISRAAWVLVSIAASAFALYIVRH